MYSDDLEERIAMLLRQACGEEDRDKIEEMLKQINDLMEVRRRRNKQERSV